MDRQDAIEAVALVLNRPHELPELSAVVVDPPGPHEARVRILAAGLCHTDLGYVRYARQWPVVLGHEGAGVVESVGRGVSGLSPGDRVMINWRPPCFKCRSCRRNRSDQCESPQGTAAARIRRDKSPLNVMLHAGTFCEYVVVPASGVVPISPEIPYPVAAFIGCGVATGLGAALRTAQVERGSLVAVFGVGGVGLNVVQGARIAGADAIIALDLDEGRLGLASALGATRCINVNREDATEAVLASTDGRGVDFAFDVVGSPDTTYAAIHVLAQGGMAVLVGAAERDVEVSFKPRAFMSGQRSIVGCIYGNVRPNVDIQRFADWYLDGTIELDGLLTDDVSLWDLPSRFTLARPPGHVRTTVTFADSTATSEV